uniref:Uncharacterized protein n=1 Tax=uncultured marine virus TaxID=186617 RepID=A0A0F7L590_9VIRU|nr:hypothetical protein [uncultured marine virus]
MTSSIPHLRFATRTPGTACRPTPRLALNAPWSPPPSLIAPCKRRSPVVLTPV